MLETQGPLNLLYHIQIDGFRPEESENAALFVRLGLPSTLNHQEIGAFRKRSSNRRNLKTLDLPFVVDGKHFKNGDFRK